MSKVLAVYPSRSNPSRHYTVMSDDAEMIYCNCPKWRFQKIPPDQRICNHIQDYLNSNGIKPVVKTTEDNWEIHLEEISQELKSLTGG